MGSDEGCCRGEGENFKEEKWAGFIDRSETWGTEGKMCPVCVRFYWAVKGNLKSWLLCFGVGEMQRKSEGGNALEQLLWGRTLTFPQFRRGPLTARVCGSRKRACFWLQAWPEGYIYFQSPTSFSLFSAFPHLCTSATSYLVPRGIIPNKKWLLTLRTLMSTKHLAIGIDLFDPHHNIVRLQGRCPAHLIKKQNLRLNDLAPYLLSGRVLSGAQVFWSVIWHPLH